MRAYPPKMIVDVYGQNNINIKYLRLNAANLSSIYYGLNNLFKCYIKHLPDISPTHEGWSSVFSGSHTRLNTL